LFSSVAATTVAGSGSTAVYPTTSVVGGPAGSYAFSDSNWTFDGLGESVTGAPGKFTAISGTNGAGNIVVPGAAGTAQFVILGWSANIGTTLSSVEAWLAGTGNGQLGYVGESAVSGAFTLGNLSSGGSTPASTLVSGSAPGLSSFGLGQYTPTSAPEPASIALAALGGLSLLGLRRKKA